MLIAVCALQGCATLTGSETQPVSITTQTDNGQLTQSVNCSLRNDKGAWTTMSPGFVNVTRSAEDLVIQCRKQGLPDGFARAISRAHGGMFGNIIFGGGIGALIDHTKGTGYEYPNTIPVRMGRSVVVDRSDQTKIQEEPAVPANLQGQTGPPSSVPSAQPPTHAQVPSTGVSASPPGSEVSEITSSRYAGIQFPADPGSAQKPPPIPAMSFEVEKLARAQGCAGSRRAELLTEQGAVETFRVRCDGGGELIVKCEFRNCRVLK